MKQLSEVMHGMSTQRLIGREETFQFNNASFPRLSLNKDASLLVAQKALSFTPVPGGILLQVEGRHIHERYAYRYFDYRQVFVEQSATQTLAVQIRFANPYTVRVEMQKGFSIVERSSLMLEDWQPEPVAFSVFDTEALLVLKSEQLTVEITKHPWNLTLKKADGTPYYTQFNRDNQSFMPYEICPFGFLQDGESGQQYACESFSTDPYEQFYGLGETFTGLAKKNRAVNLWNTNALGVNTDRGYKHIPFIMSTGGYGVFYHTTRKLRCDLGETLSKATNVMVEGPLLDMFIIQGDTLKELLPRYLALTGHSALPPAWSYGLWISKISYGSQQEVETVASRLRQEDIPCDVIHIDTDWFTENWVCDFRFDEEKFPDPRGMVSKLHENGFKISLWQLPYIERGKTAYQVYDEAVSKGYFAHLPNGELGFPHGLIDLSNPKAVDWYQNRLLRPLLEMGIDVIKVDFGESAPETLQYAAADPKEIHNAYALLYNKIVYDVTKQLKGSEAMIWARSAWAGSQRYPLHWGGDSGTDFGSLASSLRGCLSLGLSGFPFWSSDIGGFFFSPTPKLYIRWSQFGMFCSHARLHGFFTREPWDFGEEALTIFRQFAKLRYRLLPYILQQATEAVEQGLPVQRAMVLDYQSDPTVWELDTQYLFGDSLLVAPVLREDDLVRVYLPQGQWTHLFTGEVFSGGQWLRLEHVPLCEMPVFVKENALIPYGAGDSHVTEKALLLESLQVYPTLGLGTCTLYKEQVDVSLKAEQKRITLSFTGAVGHAFTVQLHNITASGCQALGKPIAFTNQQGDCQLQIDQELAGAPLEIEIWRE